jgi:hypothetical protein
VAQARTPGASAGVTNDPLLTRLSSGDDPSHPNRVKRRGSNPHVHRVANSNSGNGNLRPETFDGTRRNEPRRRPKRVSSPAAAPVSRGNVLLFCGAGNRAGRRGLPGGAEGIRTCDPRTAGISAHLTVARLPTAHDVLLGCARYRRRRYRRMLGRVVDCGHRSVGPGEFRMWMTSVVVRFQACSRD